MASTWRVVIPYVEPTHDVHSGSGERAPFKATYEVAAADRAEAVARALARFEGDASDSSVGWIREPLEDLIRVEPA